MGTIVDKLNLLLSTKAAIKSAIIGKGQTVADSDAFSTYPAKIQAIQTGIQLPALTNPGTAADLLADKQLIDQNGNPLTGTMPSLAEQTITPGATDQIIQAGQYLAGAQTIKGDANLLAANIVYGKSIFGVRGAAKIVTMSTITFAVGDTMHDSSYEIYYADDGIPTCANCARGSQVTFSVPTNGGLMVIFSNSPSANVTVSGGMDYYYLDWAGYRIFMILPDSAACTITLHE